MSENNLPIKVVLQKSTDVQANKGGGSTKFFGTVTPELQEIITQKLENILDYYEDVFEESQLVPAVGKITMKSEAIAKSHKPNDFCRCCPIIGSQDLNEIYIRITQESINQTISLISKLPSEKFRANMTAIQDIQPITASEKISKGLLHIKNQGNFERIRGEIKVKLFDFDDAFDNAQIMDYVLRKLSELGFSDSPTIIAYGDKIQFIKLSVNSFEDISDIAAINGVKSVDFFQEYSLPLNNYMNTDLECLLQANHQTSEVTIGIIDGGISRNNQLLKPYIKERKEYIPPEYINEHHGTFIASTIQYGNALNGITPVDTTKFNFIDIVAIPNSDSDFGPTDSISEEDLMEIIEDAMQKYSQTTKIWNMSLGIESMVCDGSMSDLGIFLDYIQDKYNVQFFVSSGNLNQLPLRTWPAQSDMNERDRIISPADSVRAITVGSIALYEAEDSIVRSHEPSPFSRRGPGANYIVKPDVVDYGGNLSTSLDISGLGMKGLDINGRVIEGNGTSYSNPRIVQKYASICDEMVDRDLLLAKAMLIHSARMNSRDLLEKNPDYIKYYGFGMPSIRAADVLQCNDHEVTLVFKQKIPVGTHLEMLDFPYPPSLIRNGKCFGEICMTLAYNPILDDRFGREYCRTNIDASFGIYKIKPNNMEYKGQVPLECAWDEKFEQARVENGFKWSPIKSYYRKIDRGINVGDGWKIRIDMTPRNEVVASPQEFVLILTIKDSQEHDIYSEMINGLRERGYITNNLETRQKIRYRN